MRVTSKITGGFAVLGKMLSLRGDRGELDRIGTEGTKVLSENTPVDTGETSRSWYHRVKTTRNGGEVVWYNTSHPESPVSIPKLIEYGHATRTGGYVQPRKFIRRSLRKVTKRGVIRIMNARGFK